MGMINGARIVSTMIDGSLGGAALETALGTAATLASFREAISNRRIARALAESTTAMTALVASARASGAAGSSSAMIEALSLNPAAATTFCNTRAAVAAAGTGTGALYNYLKWTNKASYGYPQGFASSGTVLVGVTATGIASSTDGITFTARTNPNSTNATTYGSLAYGLGLFVMVNTTGAASALACSSPDGTTWTARTKGNYIATQVGFGGGFFTATGSTGTWDFSTNGTTWTAWSGPFSAANSETRFAEGDDELIICNSTNAYFLKMGTTAPFIRLTSALGFTPAVCGYINGVYYVATSTTAFKYSLDQGNSWISGTLPAAATGNQNYKTFFANGRAYMPGNGHYFLSSADGINWIVETYGDSLNAYMISGGTLGGLVCFTTAGARIIHNAP